MHNEQNAPSSLSQNAPTLKRAIGFPRLLLYGLGTTIGAGIYVLVGETAARAGEFAPMSFLFSAIVMAFSAASFAEFSGRVPKSAGEALYIDQGFHQAWLAALSGYAIILAAIVATATISIGCAGYVAQIISLPEPVIVCAIFLTLGTLAIWGIQESITIAAVLTLVEIGGLLIIVGAGLINNPDLLIEANRSIPVFNDSAAWGSIFSASLIAFFAFIGFDDVVNVIEETIEPARIMPRVLATTLLIVTVLYILVCLVALDALPLDELSASKAPIGLLFERLTGLSPLSITLIAIAATMNGIVIQIIMGSRVAYGLGKQSYLPATITKINPVTRTPIFATVFVTLIGLVFALFLPLDKLAAFTSQLILLIFGLVNISLILIKIRKEKAPKGTFVVPIIVPVLGAITCFLWLLGPFVG